MAGGLFAAFEDYTKLLQLYSAGLISRRAFLEKSGLVTDVDEELRRIEQERRP